MSPKLLKSLGGILIFAAVAVMMIWFVSGAHWITQYQVETTVVEEDEFGDEMERTVMQDEFRFGMLPDKGYDAAGPLTAVFGGLGLVLLFIARRKGPGDEEELDSQPEPDDEPGLAESSDTSDEEKEQQVASDDEDDEEDEEASDDEDDEEAEEASDEEDTEEAEEASDDEDDEEAEEASDEEDTEEDEEEPSGASV